MKAISFLEYYKRINQEKLNADKFSEEKINLSGSSLLYSKNIHYNNSFEFLNAYYELVSQPFSFEKVIELFEGFWLDKYKALDSLEHDKFWMCIDESGLHIWIKRTVYPDYSTITPKTIDEFIVLCNNLNIKLTWKQ